MCACRDCRASLYHASWLVGTLSRWRYRNRIQAVAPSLLIFISYLEFNFCRKYRLLTRVLCTYFGLPLESSPHNHKSWWLAPSIMAARAKGQAVLKHEAKCVLSVCAVHSGLPRASAMRIVHPNKSVSSLKPTIPPSLSELFMILGALQQCLFWGSLGNPSTLRLLVEFLHQSWSATQPTTTERHA